MFEHLIKNCVNIVPTQK
jgi:hypothetical protein